MFLKRRVHRKNGSKHPSSEWVVVENAHPALITPELARAVVSARKRNKKKLLRTCILEMQLAPENLEVAVTYRIPEPFMIELVAGASYLPLHIRTAFWQKFQFAA